MAETELNSYPAKVLDTITEGVVVIGADGRYAFTNEAALLAAQQKAEEVLLVAEESVRKGLPELPEAERLVRAEVAADALRDVRRAAANALREVESTAADVLLRAQREAAAILLEARMKVLDGRTGNDKPEA